MKTWLIIINNFVHDLFTGLWISTILVIYLLGREAGSRGTVLASSLQEVMRVFFWLGIFSVLIIIVTGIFRFINYKSTNGGTLGPVKKNILIFKHILLGASLLMGTYSAYNYTFH